MLVLCCFAVLLGACGSDNGSRSDASSADATCETPLQYGDLRNPDDDCWDPPESYCSAGAGGAETTACSPDGGECCRRPDTCVPCGWVVCGEEPDGCPDEDTIAELVEASSEDCNVLERPFCPSEFASE